MIETLIKKHWKLLAAIALFGWAAYVSSRALMFLAVAFLSFLAWTTRAWWIFLLVAIGLYTAIFPRTAPAAPVAPT